MTDASRSTGSTDDGARTSDAPATSERWSRRRVANALFVGGLLAVPLTFLGLGRIPNRLLWTIVGSGLLAAAIGFLAIPHARIAWLEPLQRSLLYERTEAELTARATMAYLVLGVTLLAAAGWVLFISTKV